VIPALDPTADALAAAPEIEAAIGRVLRRGRYVLGPEVEAFEHELAQAHCGSGAVGVASGTDALMLALVAVGVGPGDEVLVPSHTAVATAAAIVATGASPVFVDVDPATAQIDPQGLEDGYGKRTRAVVPVHLYGMTVDLDAVVGWARDRAIAVVEDCAQAQSATWNDRPVGVHGDAGAFSFYPTKILGAIGDGGAVVSNRPDVVDRVRRLRQYGWAPDQRISIEVGTNSRLDELQAAVLRVRLRMLDQAVHRRQAIARRYRDEIYRAGIAPLLEYPRAESVYSLFVVRSTYRARFRADLDARGVGSMIHYPLPVHRQPAYEHYRTARPRRDLAATDHLAAEVVTLPLYPSLSDDRVSQVVEAVNGV
jgi:dTDP-4-amino-4,6-dideoxygalactose transaminase